MANAQVNVNFIPNRLGGRNLVFEGFEYRIKSRNNDRIHWRCCQSGCGGTINTMNDIVTTQNNQHNHEADIEQVAVDAYLAKLKNKMIDGSNTASSIYQEEIANLRGEDFHPGFTAKIPTFYSVRSALYRSRSKSRPPLPRHRSDIDLPEIYTKTTAGEDFLIACDGDNDKILIFRTENNLRHLSSAEIYFCDGTFNKCPNVFFQLYTIHAFVENKMCPLVFGLLPNKTQQTYDRFFQLVVDRAGQFGINLAPRQVFTDYETAAQNAIRLTFPTVTPKGCFFHYGQAVWKYAQKSGLKTLYQDDEEVQRVVRRAIALPLVPVDLVSEAWFLTLEEAPINSNVELFTDYMTTYWVEGDHGQFMWNHFDTVGPHTTNHIEGWHRKLSLFIVGSHPNIFKLMDFLKKEQAFHESTILQLSVGGKLAPREKKYRKIDNSLGHFKRVFQAGEIGLLQYLDSVSHSTGF